MPKIKRVIIFVLYVVPILAVILALFVAPLRADQTTLNDPVGWETVFGDGWSADSTQLLPETVDGYGTWYLEPQFTRWYRLGGVVVLATLVYLSEVFGKYLPLFV